jgi:hypothetical protein
MVQTITWMLQQRPAVNFEPGSNGTVLKVIRDSGKHANAAGLAEVKVEGQELPICAGLAFLSYNPPASLSLCDSSISGRGTYVG